MTIKQQIAEARGLCRDIERDLQRVEELRGAGNPREQREALVNTFDLLLPELNEHVYELLKHYDAQARKRAR